jgi:hypothetical protein
MEQPGASVDKAKEWVGDVIERVGRSFRRAQSMPRRANIASFYNRQNYQRKRSAGLENLRTEECTYFNRLKSYWSSAFQDNDGHEDDEKHDSANNDDNGPEDDARHGFSNIEEGFYQKNNTSLEVKNIMKSTTAHSSSCSMSISTRALDGSTSSLCYSRMSRRKSEIVHTEIVQRVSVGNESSYGRLASQQKESTDSGCCIDYKESVDEQQSFEDEQYSSKYWWRTELENLKQDDAIDDEESTKNVSTDSNTTPNERTKTDFEETFSKNYSVFCEKLDNIQKAAGVSFDQECMAKSLSFNLNCLSSASTKNKNTSVLRKTPKPDGVITISMQHFQKSRQLRIILHSVESSVENNRKMLCKVTLTGKRKPQKGKSRTTRSNNGNADIKKTFYMNSDEDLIGYVLNIQLRTVSRILKRQTVVCEASIALENIDLDLDTTMTVKMYDPETMKQVLIFFLEVHLSRVMTKPT